MPEELHRYRDLPRSEQVVHRFQPCSNGTVYKFNSIGFLWIAYVARTVFRWLPDQQAVVALQLVVHGASALVVLSLLGGRHSSSDFRDSVYPEPTGSLFCSFPYNFWTSLASLVFLLALFSGDGLGQQWSS